MDPKANKQPSPQSLAQRRLIHITVKDKNGVIMNEDVKAVSSYNDVGLFDVLPLHTHFISLIKKKLIIHGRKDGKDREMTIGTGLMRVTDNLVNIYLGLPDPGPSSQTAK